MSYQFYGKRRTATPVSNRTRAVAHRHIPYHPSVQHSITVTMEEKVESLTILPLSQPEPQKSQEKPLTRPQKRKLRKRNLIELQAKQPHTGLLEKVFLPLRALRYSTDSCFIEYTGIGCVLASLALWLCIGWIPAANVCQSINAHGFSYAIVPFATQFFITVCIAVMGMAVETATLLLISIVSRLTGAPIRWCELYDTRTHALPTLLILAVIGVMLAADHRGLSSQITTCLIALLAFVDGYTVYLYHKKFSVAIWISYAAGIVAAIPCMHAITQMITERLSVFTQLIQ